MGAPPVFGYEFKLGKQLASTILGLNEFNNWKSGWKNDHIIRYQLVKLAIKFTIYLLSHHNNINIW